MIASFRNAWSPLFGDGTANGGFGVTVGGEDPVFGQPIGYIGSFTYSNGQEIRDDETRALAQATSDGLRPLNETYGGTVRNSGAVGRYRQPEHPARRQQQALAQQHVQPKRRQRGDRAGGGERGV